MILSKRPASILWVLLVITLVLSCSGIILRMSNESKNKAVVTTIDYGEFLKTANMANMNMDDILVRAKASGVHTVAVNEVSLRDLAQTGDVNLSTYADFSTFTDLYFPAVKQQADQAIGNREISPASLVVATNQAEVSRFLKERLGARFTPEEIISFSAQGTDYFIMNAELRPVVVDMNQSDKNKPVVRELDARLGFDLRVLDKLKKMGFDIMLRPGYNTGSNTSYLAEYEKTIRDYQVKYLVFGDTQLNGAPDRLEWIEQPIKKYHMIVGIIETSAQLQYIQQKGLDELMESTGYPINRVYSSTNDEFVTSASERYYRWVRSTIDRGIRILYVVPFKDQKVNYAQNMDNTLQVIKDYHATIQAKGFDINAPLPQLSDRRPGAAHGLMVSLSLLCGGLLYLFYLIKPGRRVMVVLLTAGLIVCLGLNLVLGADLSKLYALAAAILYPSLSSLLLLLYLKHHRRQPLWVQLLASLAIILGINAIGMYTVVTSLADIRYIMNVGVFSGVKVAFLAPLLLFVVNYLCCFAGKGKFKDNLKTYMYQQPNYLILFLFMVGALVLYVYVGRSGNTSGLQVSGLEIRLREILENIFLARPRFKELIIGYPALFMLVYLYRKYGKEYIALILGLGVTMGSISMVNSFCHVFTAVMISLNRTLGGLLIGVIIGIGAIIGVMILEWLVQRYWLEAD
jgi:hypothetical protein